MTQQLNIGSKRTLEQLKIIALLKNDKNQHKKDIFNQTYILLTEEYQGAIKTLKFRDLQSMERFYGNFADYYLTAFEQQKSLPKNSPWQQYFYGQKKNISDYRLLLLGASAHINHDLALALRSSRFPIHNKADFWQFQNVIIQTVPKVVILLQNELPLGHWRFSQKIYTWLISKLLFTWRKRAWRTAFSKTDHSHLHRQLIQQSNKIADLSSRSVILASLVSFIKS